MIFRIIICVLCALGLVLPGKCQPKQKSVYSEAIVLMRSSDSSFRENLHYFENLLAPSLDTLHLSTNEDRKSLVEFVLNLGYHYEVVEKDFFRAHQLYQKGKWILEEGMDTTDFKSWSFAVHSLANMHSRFGDYQRASYYFELLKEERLRRDPSDPYLPGLYLDLSQAYHAGGLTQKAFNSIEPLEPNNLIDANYALFQKMRYAIDLKEIDLAKEYMNDLSTQMKSLPDVFMRPSKSTRVSKWHSLRSELLMIAKDYEGAVRESNLAIETFPNKKGRDLAKLLHDKAHLLSLKGSHDSAWRVTDLALDVLMNNEEYDINEAPVFLENTLVENYHLRAKLYANQNPESYESDNALYWFQKAVEVDFYIRDQLLFESSQTQIHSNNKRICSDALDYCYGQYQQTTNREYLLAALTYAEYNKAAILRDADKQKRFSGTSKDGDLDQRSMIRLEIADLNRAIREQVFSDSVHLQALKSKLVKLEIKLSELKPSEEYRNSSLLFFDESKVAELMSYLSKEAAGYQNYFMGQEDLYKFTITADHFGIDRYPVDAAFLNNLVQYKSLLQRPWTTQEESNAFLHSSSGLLKCLSPLKSDIKNWYVSFDEALHGISLGALMIQASPPIYLIEEFNFNYQYSPLVWMETYATHDVLSDSLSILSVTPQEFDNKDISDLAFSYGNIQQVSRKAQYIHLEKGDARFEQVMTQMPKADIIHFHTHGEWDPYNRLQLYDGALYVDELELAELSADLVILSACETAVGKVSKSEGPMSMARGFAKAGVPTTIMTLWKINNLESQDILDHFFQYLGQGANSAHSLNRAQRDYLSNASGVYKQPYYWAGLIHMGRQYEVPQSSSHWLYLLLGLPVLLTLFFFRKNYPV